MQLCDSCGACRETEWRVCPFCRFEMSPATSSAANDSGGFDALAAAAETNNAEVLPSPVVDTDAASPDDHDDSDLITAHDLAHLTGDAGPSANGWDSSANSKPAAPTETSDGIDAPVSKLVVVPLVALALAAVAFVAFSIVTSEPTERPEAVALVDRTTTTTIATTTTTEPPFTDPGVGQVGTDVAEQAARLCSGAQFSIARAEAPSLAIYNDVLTATRDGRDDWTAPADHVTLRASVPPLIGCLTTADGGEIDRCPTTGYIISRRSVTWSYRVLQTVDGTELGSASGTATDVVPCEELVASAAGEDIGSWSPLPQDQLDAVAVAYTSAPHPLAACSATPSPQGNGVADDATDQSNEADLEAPAFETGLALHAAFADATDVDVELPESWAATDERPVEAVLCLERISDGSTSIIAMHRDGRYLGSWEYDAGDDVEPATSGDPSLDWWVETVGPELGYVLEADSSSDGE